MSTLRDLLNDFAEELLKKGGFPESYKEANEQMLEVKEDLIEEYVEIICKRWVGQD